MEEKMNGTHGPSVKVVVEEPKAPEIEKQRLADLLTGKAPPKNPTCAYLIQKMNAASIRAQQNLQERSALTNKLRELEVETTKIEGVLDQYLQDLAYWDTINAPVEVHKSEDS